MALYVKKENGDYLVENGKKIEYTTDYHSDDEDFTNETRLLINDDGHTETDKHLIVKKGEKDEHVIKSQVADIIRDSFLDLWVSENFKNVCTMCV